VGIEIDMLKVGDADAIAMRYINLDGSIFVAVIDGGYQDNGKDLANLIRTRYNRTYIDLMVSTHPDQDHISGLTALLDLMPVYRVWVHDPSRHPAATALSATSQRTRMYQYQANAVMKSMDNLSDFIAIVDRKRIPREEPFKGLSCGPLVVVGPTIPFYEQMLNEIAQDQGFAKSLSLSLAQENLSEVTLEQYPEYAIDENNETAPSNNTSTILWAKDGDKSFLFTGDAGVQAFESAQQSYNFPKVYWLQVPHHGSRRNLNSALVKYLNPHVAFISADGNTKHPSKAVVNALKRVNASVYSTHKSNNLWHHQGAEIPDRADYTTAEPL
jgi:beta-lactamase superfamily II metal-dependent hydrolase